MDNRQYAIPGIMQDPVDINQVMSRCQPAGTDPPMLIQYIIIPTTFKMSIIFL